MSTHTHGIHQTLRPPQAVPMLLSAEYVAKLLGFDQCTIAVGEARPIPEAAVVRRRRPLAPHGGRVHRQGWPATGVSGTGWQG
jgi:hypothetical protein